MKKIFSIIVIGLFFLIPDFVKANEVVTAYVFYNSQNNQYDNLIDMFEEIKEEDKYTDIFEYYTIDLSKDANLTNKILTKYYYIDYNNFFYILGSSYYTDFLDDKGSSTYIARKQLCKTQIDYYSTHDYIDNVEKLLYGTEVKTTTKSSSTGSTSNIDELAEDNFLIRFVLKMYKDRKYRLIVMTIFFSIICINKLRKTIKKYR